MATTTVDFLIPELRLHLGDMDATAYRYIDSWLQTSLIMAVKTLGRWWNFKYLMDTLNAVYRNPYSSVFLFPEPPVIELQDERIIILMASIIIKEGSLQNSSWNSGSWRDFEISYSNIEGGRMRDTSLKQDWAELTSLITPPVKKLAVPLKGSLPGYKNNLYETNSEQ